MWRWVVVCILGLLLVGCKEREEPLAEPPVGEQPSATQKSGGDVGVVSPAAGLSSPVTGSDSVGGGGGGGTGVGQAAKDQAKRVISESQGGSVQGYDDN